MIVAHTVRQVCVMEFKYFFWEKNDIFALPDGGASLGFDLYSAGHLIWLGAIVVAAWIASNLYKGLGGGNSLHLRSNAVENAENLHEQQRKRRRVRRFFALALFVSEIYRDSVLALTGHFTWEYLPFHLCGLAIFAILIDAFFEEQKITGQLISYAFMPGAFSALLFCNWTEYPFLNFMNIHSFVFHGWIFIYFLMRYRSGELQPSYKGVWMSTLMAVLLVGPLFAFNSHFGTNFMFVNEASPGSPLVPIWNLLYEPYGYAGYFAGCFVLVLTVFHVLWLVYTIIAKLHKKR